MAQQLALSFDQPTAYRASMAPEPLWLREHVQSFSSHTDAEVIHRLLGREPAEVPPLRNLLDQPVEELCGTLGLDRQAVDQIAAACELGSRLARAPLMTGDLLNHPEAVVRYIAPRYCRASQEVMGALFFDIRNRLVGECELFVGTISRAAVEPRPVFERALACRASGFLLFHNHPSGDPSPSAEDLVFTRRLADAGEVMSIRLIDHLVIGHADRWTSLRSQGGW